MSCAECDVTHLLLWVKSFFFVVLSDFGLLTDAFAILHLFRSLVLIMNLIVIARNDNHVRPLE